MKRYSWEKERNEPKTVDQESWDKLFKHKFEFNAFVKNSEKTTFFSPTYKGTYDGSKKILFDESIKSVVHDNMKSWVRIGMLVGTHSIDHRGTRSVDRFLLKYIDKVKGKPYYKSRTMKEEIQITFLESFALGSNDINLPLFDLKLPPKWLKYGKIETGFVNKLFKNSSRYREAKAVYHVLGFNPVWKSALGPMSDWEKELYKRGGWKFHS